MKTKTKKPSSVKGAKRGPKRPSKRGRPGFYHTVESLAAKGLTQRQIALILDVAESQFSVWKSSDPKFSQAFEKGVAAGIERRLKRIEDAGRRSWQANAWVLERRYPDQFARRTELTGPEGGPIQSENTGQVLLVKLPDNGKSAGQNGSTNGANGRQTKATAKAR